MTALRSLTREEFDDAWSTRPATRIGRTLLFPGGRIAQLSRTQRLLFALGLRKSLSTPHHERRSL